MLSTSRSPKAIELAAKIAARPRLGVQMSKELLNASIGAGGFREHLELELRSQVIGLVSEDHRAAVLEFLAGKAKRKQDKPFHGSAPLLS